MIIEEIPVKANGEIYKSRCVNCKCDDCGQVFRRYVFAALKDARRCKSCSTINYNKTRDPTIHKKMVDNAAKTWKGKTRIEVCGIEKAEAARLSQSKKNSGRNNPNFGGKYSRGFADNPLTGKWEDVFGKEEADRRKAETSKRVRGSGNPMYGKPSPKKSGNGISGWWKNKLYFRSLLELAFILKCDQEGKVLKCAEKKEFRVNYQFRGNVRTYVPDFVDETGQLYECKPEKLLSSEIVRAKMAAAPNVKVVTDKILVRPTLSELQFLIRHHDVKIDETKQWRINDNNKCICCVRTR